MAVKSITLKACAKINLHLDVVSKADNGYHEVRTVMQTLSLSDTVRVSLCEDGGIRLTCSFEGLPCDRQNIAYRAAELFFEKTGISHGVSIEITKRIPIAAGLAGGSTDAAAVLRALNILCSEPLCLEELCELGARLGADVPFCILGGTKYADGYGEALHDFPKMPECFVVVAKSGEGVSTPLAYSALDEAYRSFESGAHIPVDLSALEKALESGDVLAVSQNTYNIFEGVIEPMRPAVSRIKRVMLDSGALCAMMSGSGPSVFGIYRDEDAAENAVKRLESENIEAFAALPVELDF